MLTTLTKETGIICKNGLNIYKGAVTYEAVAEDLGYAYLPADEALQVAV